MVKVEKDKNPWYSAKDIARRYGKSRQYWSYLMAKGKIKTKETAAGPITTHEWLLESGFINKK